MPTLEESEESVESQESRALQHILPAGPQSLLIPATLAALHKVNLPLKIWYLLTCLMELDGCLTFIEFFFTSEPSQPPSASDVIGVGAELQECGLLTHADADDSAWFSDHHTQD